MNNYSENGFINSETSPLEYFSLLCKDNFVSEYIKSAPESWLYLFDDAAVRVPIIHIGRTSSRDYWRQH